MPAGGRKKGFRAEHPRKKREETALALTTEPLKYSQKKLEERRARVFQLRYMLDYKPEVIAETLGVSRATIFDDLRALSDVMSDQMRNTDTVATVGLRQAVYAKLLGMAVSGHGDTKNHRTKNLYILTALKVHNARVAFESDVGLLPSKKTQIDLRFRRTVEEELEDPEFIEAIKNPDSRRKLVQFVEKFERLAEVDGDPQYPFEDIPKPADVIDITPTAPPAPTPAEVIEKAKQVVAPPVPRVKREPG